MPFVSKSVKKNHPYPDMIERIVVLTYERPGFISKSVESLLDTCDCKIDIHDDGSTLLPKRTELELLGNRCNVYFHNHSGFVETWMNVFKGLSKELGSTLSESGGIVLVEDDILFSQGWDDCVLRMASGCSNVGYKPGAMTCFRCHEEIQSPIVDLNGIPCYSSMMHGFQLNFVPNMLFHRIDILEEAARMSKAGRHGLDVWFIGLMAHRLGMTSFVSCKSKVAHFGGNASVVKGQGFRSFEGFGFELDEDLLRKAVSVSNELQFHGGF